MQSEWCVGVGDVSLVLYVSGEVLRRYGTPLVLGQEWGSRQVGEVSESNPSRGSYTVRSTIHDLGVSSDTGVIQVIHSVCFATV